MKNFTLIKLIYTYAYMHIILKKTEKIVYR